MPQLMEFRRTKSSIAQRDMPDQLAADKTREDPLSAQFQKQIISRKSFFTDQRQVAPTVVVRRRPDEKLKNPDRISLDGQNLTSCPILENEDSLRLLNYQYNLITQIQHMDSLKKLILLDLYDNRVEKISGLDSLRCLRVLMLGRNRISKIEGLSSLTRLDVLDLHANNISRLENLSHLQELRVLNVAGNQLRALEPAGLAGLHSIIELNARRNQIEQVSQLGSSLLPSLQRLYLSYNNIMKLSDFACLAELTGLLELSVDNNPLCRHNNVRSSIIFHFPQLEQLDLKPILDDEKYRAKQIVNRLELTVKPNSHLSRHLIINNQRNEDQSTSLQKFHSLKDRRRSHLTNCGTPSSLSTSNQKRSSSISDLSATQSSGSTYQNPLSPTMLNGAAHTHFDGSGGGETVMETNTGLNQSLDERDMEARYLKSENSTQASNSSLVKEFVSIEETLVRTLSNVSKTVYQKPLVLRPSSSSSSLNIKSELIKPVLIPNSKSVSCLGSRDIPLPINPNEPSYEATSDKNGDTALPEISNDNEDLCFYSKAALSSLSEKDFWVSRSTWSSSVINITFRNIAFADIEKQIPIFKSRFPNLKKIVFGACGMDSFKHINSLANLRRLEELIIEYDKNPIASFKLLKSYVIFRLSHLGIRRFNDEEILSPENGPVQEHNMARRLFLNLTRMGPSAVTQLHLQGLLTDTRRRELLQQPSYEPPPLLPVASSPVDVMGRTGLLLPSPPTFQPGFHKREVSACSQLVDNVVQSVQAQCRLEAAFHDQWLGAVYTVLASRLQAMLPTARGHFMRHQFERVLLSSKQQPLSNS